MGSVTGTFQYFQSEAPLHPAARAALTEAFDRGWSDPTKPHFESRKAAILLNEAKETFAAHLGVRPDQIEFLSSPSSGFHLGIAGLALPGSTVYYPATARSEVFAVGDHLSGHKLGVDLAGQALWPRGLADDLLCWQSGNGETGVISKPPVDFIGRVFVDATASAGLLPLPSRWHGALWDSRSWQGPAGLGIFAISEKNLWRNPLPHIDQKITSPDFSLPLALASAIALDAFSAEYEVKRKSLIELNERIRDFLLTEIGQVDIAGSLSNTLPHLLSFSFLYIDAAILMSELDRRGFSVDSGSACNATNMEPSHVLAAMGLLTHGNIRLTLHPQMERTSVETFLATLKDLVVELRS